ncbi:biotin--[acetyl-CoA-carboxylase] ligase [Aestuariimicrobium ganziense]|uniref:biotin--[acetyl-CoA-carboxylase] ligase n=1 Tax=Aestuariimicrobium ganziense TaxID=2773677 RepID=UPI002E2BB2AE|nr:biotin--[acetyl-CoA-carboxylase] ligase [Aestuariimicrobium ganziense]
MAWDAVLDVGDLRSRLRAAGVRWDVSWVPETGSTNRDLARWVAGADEAVARVLVADHQTAGRGRFDRAWTAPPGSSLAISVAVWPGREFLDWTWLPLVTGVAVLRGLGSVVGASVAERLVLKWPNDVLVAGDGGVGAGKLCGILAERVDGGVLGRPAAVIGFGINISMQADELPVPTATSLLLAAGSDEAVVPSKSEVVAAVVGELAGLLEVWERRGHLREAYTEACGSLGVPLRVHVSASEVVEGVGESVDEQGRLVVRTAQGLQSFAAGDVVHLR